VDASEIAGGMLSLAPANMTLGIRVVSAVDGVGVVEMEVREGFANVIGSLHASGLVALIDAASLAALISAAEHPEQLGGLTPLGSRAVLEFLVPARGPLLGRCQLSPEDLDSLQNFFSTPATAPLRLTTTADVLDRDGVVACRGSFDWSIRRS